jgi:DNA-binding transcriptional MerR regulator
VEGAEELTIDELAARVGMTVRNIRAHQSRGLVPPPRLVGRVGYYDAEHVRRLDRIRQLQDEGLNLAAVARLIDDDRLAEVAAAPFTDDAPVRYPPGVVAERLGVAVDDPAVARALALELIDVDDDQVVVELPRLLAVASELADQGVPLDAMLDVVEEVREASAQVARAFMRLADAHLVEHVVVDTGGDLDAITGVVEALQGQAQVALDVLFNRAMAAEIRAYLAPSAPTPAPVTGDR